MDLYYVFANRSEKEEIFLLTVSEIAEKQLENKSLQQQKVLMKLEDL